MNFATVCSGIGAPECAWIPLGWNPVFCAEIEKFPSLVLSHHYSHTPNLGDFTKIGSEYAGSVDVLAAGTPCQDFSVAGLRAGMDGKRGQLTVEYAHLAGRLRPRWLVWENVPGVLSIDGGRAFGAFIGMLGKLGYGVAYRVLDAQYFGVPQRRRRVFVVGYLGDWRRAAAVLFERQSLSGHPAPSREAGQGFTHDIAPSLTGSGRGTERTGESRGQDPVIAVAQTLTSGGTGARGHLDPVNTTLGPVCMATGQGSAEIGIGIGTTLNCNHEAPIVTHSLRAEGFDASEDGTGRGTPLVPVAFRACGQDGFTPSEICPPITSTDGGGAGVPTIALSCKDHGADAGSISPTLRSMGHDGSHANAGGQVAVAMNLRGREGGAMPELDDLASIRAASGGSSRSYVAGAMAVRRLTPRECERLQGFPYDYTKISDKTADGPRYKALGNSMAVPVMRWIGERIDMVENLVNGEYLIPPQVEFDVPMEALLSDEDIEVEGFGELDEA